MNSGGILGVLFVNGVLFDAIDICHVCYSIYTVTDWVLTNCWTAQSAT